MLLHFCFVIVYISSSQFVHGPREDLHLLEVDVHELHACGRAGLRGHGALLHRVAHHLAHGVSGDHRRQSNVYLRCHVVLNSTT